MKFDVKDVSSLLSGIDLDQESDELTTFSLEITSLLIDRAIAAYKDDD